MKGRPPMKGTGIYRDAKALEKWLADQGGPARKCARCALPCKQPEKVVVVACDRYKKTVTRPARPERGDDVSGHNLAHMLLV